MNAYAVVFTAPNQVEFCQVTCPEPGPGDVVVRLTHSWISNGTEGSFLRGERIAGDTPYRPGDPWPFPIVASYQKVGAAERCALARTLGAHEAVAPSALAVDDRPWAPQFRHVCSFCEGASQIFG